MATNRKSKASTYTLELYEVATGKLIDTPIKDSTERLNAINQSNLLKTDKITTLTKCYSESTSPAYKDAIEDVQNDLLWSSYDVMR